MSDRRFSMGSGTDDPPNSRLFIIAPKHLVEDDFRKAFQDFGDIEEIWVVKDRNTGENKGVTYIKYAKTSHAAKALEAMNGKSLNGGGRPIKVMVAASREQGSKRDSNEEERVHRLFVMIPKNMNDTELYDYFKQWGDIDYASVIRDKNTRESKGFAYVKYMKFSQAAAAFEQCDRKYKPVFAEPPRKANTARSDDRNFSSSSFEAFGKSSNMSLPSENFGCDGYSKLMVIANPSVNQDQLWKLFDIVPGMEYCQVKYEGDRVRPSRALAEVVYSSPQWAAHAKDKLHGFEYPPGSRLIIRPEYENVRGPYGGVSKPLDKQKPDILQIAETIAQASSLIQAAGLSPDLLQAKLGVSLPPSRENDKYCSIKLPSPQPLVSIDEETIARCFIVCTPSALPNHVLKDIFCRFGNLIDVYMLNNRNCGYAKYASRASADEAIHILHGAEILGIRIKVLEAEEKPDNQRKRQRMELDSPF